MHAIYARQSVSKKDSISIETQIELCKAGIPKGELYEIYTDEGFTGTNMNRPAFRSMVRDIERGLISVVHVYRFDRISRSLSDFARLSEQLNVKGVTLVSATEMIDTGAPMGIMLVRLLVMFAELEQQTIAERLRDNYRARAGRLKPLGGTPPYGYNKDFIPDKNAETVRRIYSLALSGLSLDSIGKKLSFDGIPSPKGSLWTGQQVGRCLRNPVYVRFKGLLVPYFNRENMAMLLPQSGYMEGRGVHLVRSQSTTYIAPGTHDGLIEAEIWLAVQDVLLARKPSSSLGSGKSSWLQGLMLCGKCGSTCYIRTTCKGEYSYIVCSGRRKGICSGIRALHTQPVEKYVSGVLDGEVRSYGCAPYEDRELARLTARRYEPAVAASFERLSLQNKKAVAKLLIKNVILTEDRWEIILR